MVWQWYPKWKCIQTPEKSYATIQLCHPLSAIPAISFCLLQPLFLLGTNANLQHPCFPVPTVLLWFASTKKQITRSTFETFNCQCEKNTNLLVKNGKKKQVIQFPVTFVKYLCFFQSIIIQPQTVVTYPNPSTGSVVLEGSSPSTHPSETGKLPALDLPEANSKAFDF